MDVVEYWRQLPQDVRLTIARAALAVLVLALVWFLRRMLTLAIVAPLRRMTQNTRYEWASLLLDTFTPSVRLLVIVLGVVIGIEILEIDRSTTDFIQHLIRSLIILAIFVAFFRFVDIIAPTSSRLLRLTGLNVSERLLPFLRTAVKILIAAMALVIVIQEWGYDVSGLVAGLGLGGLAFSLAAQDTVANLFGFTTIVGDQPFLVGEFIKTPDVEGIVEHVGVRSTRIRQLNQGYVTIPNSRLASSVILNWSRLSRRWLDLTLPIGYNATSRDIEQVIVRIRELLLSRELVQKETVLVHFIDFGDDGLRILVRCYISLTEWAAFTVEKEQIFLGIMKIVEDLGLSIAFPGRSVYIENAPFFPTGSSPAASTTEESTS